MRCNSNADGRSHLKVSVMHKSTALILSGSLFPTHAVLMPDALRKIDLNEFGVSLVFYMVSSRRVRAIS